MDKNQIFASYYKRLRIEGIIKSLIFAAVIGLFAGFIVSLACFFAVYNGLWIALLAIFLITGGLTPLLYFKIFRPTTKAIAARIDRLGLEERLITMLELENDESYIALRQREDAQQKLAGVSANRLKFSFLKTPFVILGVVAVAAIAMTAVSAISGANPGLIYGEGEENTDIFISVTYLAGEGGYVEGAALQEVYYGTDADMVFAVELDWFVFDKWDDGVTDPVRNDLNVTKPLTVTALFIALVEGEEDVGSKEPGEPGEPQPDQPPSDTEESDQDLQPPNDGNDQDSGGKGGEQNKLDNAVDNGEDWYVDRIDSESQKNLNEIADNPDLPDYLKEMAEEYYKNINVSKEDNNKTP